MSCDLLYRLKLTSLYWSIWVFFVCLLNPPPGTNCQCDNRRCVGTQQGPLVVGREGGGCGRLRGPSLDLRYWRGADHRHTQYISCKAETLSLWAQSFTVPRNKCRVSAPCPQGSYRYIKFIFSQPFWVRCCWIHCELCAVWSWWFSRV